jgi:glycine/D-amino acid oxidase-like deaminating enzyme
MTKSTPFWLDRMPRSRRPSYPRWTGEGDAQAVVVGGGLTGCACAYGLAAAGIRVLLLEAETIGAGATAGSPGIVRQEFDAPFGRVARAQGLRTARGMWQVFRRTSLDFAATLRRLRIKCDLLPTDLLRISLAGEEASRMLRREYRSRREAGIEGSWMTPQAVLREAAMASGGAIRSKAFTIDPYRAALGLAAAAAARKAQIFERSPVRRIRSRRTGLEIQTARGLVRADAVIVATRARLPDLRALRRHLRAEHRYAVLTEPMTAAVAREVGPRSAAIEDDAAPPHLVRWMKDKRVLVSGAAQPAVPPRSQPQALVQRTGQLMYELSVLYPPISGTRAECSWHSEQDTTPDGLPCIGPHRNFPRHFFALGGGPHGDAVAWLAAKLATRWLLGKPDKGDEAFGFARII